MTERTIKVDDNNFYFNINSRQKYGMFSPGFFFNMKYPDGSVVNIPPQYINTSLEGNWFKIDGVRYIIIEPSTKTMIRNGYFVRGAYDRVQESDSSRGQMTRQQIMEDLEDAFARFLYKHLELGSPKISEKGNNFSVSFEWGKFGYEFNLLTVNNVVNKNYKRKLENLRYLPFDNKMDKYNTYYMYVQVYNVEEQLSLFGNNTSKEPEIVVSDIINEVLDEFKGNSMSYNFNEYKFVDVK